MAGTPSTYQSQARQLYMSRIGDVFSTVQAQFPAAWERAKTSHDDGEFIKRLAWACRQAGIPCYLNWKRGNVGDMSKDVLNFENSTGAPDRTGLLSGVEHVDVIISHETPSAQYGWGDVTVNTTVNPHVFNPPGAFLPTDPGGQPGTPIPGPDPCAACKSELASLKATSVAKVGYPGDATWDAFGAIYEADVKRAGQVLNAQSFRWAGRTMHDDYMEGLSLDQSIAKHRAEWCAILGIPVI